MNDAMKALERLVGFAKKPDEVVADFGYHEHNTMEGDVETIRAALEAKAEPSTAEVRAQVLDDLACYIDSLADGVPVGHEDKGRGASTFNWFVRFQGIIREFEAKRTREEG